MDREFLDSFEKGHLTIQESSLFSLFNSKIE